MWAVKQIVKKTLVNVCKWVGETSPLLLDFSDLSDGKSASLLLDTMRQARFLVPETLQAPSGKKVLVIAPHPDDEVIGMGGVMAQMVRNGCNVDVISLTFGGDEQSKDEAENAARVLGYKFTHFFEFKPKHIPVDLNTLKIFAENINDKKPDIIFLPFILDDHDDHRRANELLLATDENGLLKDVSGVQIWAYQVYTALPVNCVVNITDVIDKKSEAVSCYISRFKQRDWAHYASGLSAFNVRFLDGCTDRAYAEVFFRANISAYLKMCRVYFRNPVGRCYDIEEYNALS